MSDSTNLKYEIISSKKIMGEGQISNIKKKLLNKKFVLYSDRDDQFNIELRFCTPSIVQKIDLRLINTFRYELKLMNKKKQVVEYFNELLRCKHNQQSFTLFPPELDPVEYVSLKIQNNPENRKRIGISYIVFQGICDEIPNKKQNTKASETANHHISGLTDGPKDKTDQKTIVRKDKRSIESKQIFNDRSKQKTPKQKLINFQQYENLIIESAYKSQSNSKNESRIRKKVNYNQDQATQQQQKGKNQQLRQLRRKQLQQDTQLAIALSKSEQKMYQNGGFQKMQIEEPFMQQNDNSLPEALRNYCLIDEENYQIPDRTYDIVQAHEQYFQNFSDLTPKWLLAQKRAEIQARVRQQEKLSNYIKLKYLHGTQLYISGFPDWKQHQISQNAKQLGCKVLGQLKNHCIAIVGKQQCQKLRKKHKLWADIKYLNTEYLSDCLKFQSKLKFSDYYVKY